jgi:uncharacterized protein YggT (Ycf19 family)
MTDYQEVRTTEHEAGREQRANILKASQIIWLLLGLLEAVIALRVVFKLIAVNAANPFAAFLYSVTHPFVAPFASLASAPTSGGVVLELSSILAMIVYLLIAWGLERIVHVLFYRQRGPVSIRQTTLSEHTPQQPPVGVRQTLTTERTLTPAPAAVRQTTVTEQTKTNTPGPL